MNAFEAEQAIKRRLLPVAKDEAGLEAHFLLQHVGVDGAFCRVSEQTLAEIEPLLLRRLAGEPLPYVLGEWTFFGLPMLVNRSVLIPRPDTECLVEAALPLAKGKRVLDLCCGSGCIGIALAKFAGSLITASDVSAEALTVAKSNAARNDVSMRFVESDLFDNISESFDLIVSNPPYLTEKEMASRDAALLAEPQGALDGGADGLSFYRRIAADYRRVLASGGTMLLEIGCTQANDVQSLFQNAACLSDYGNRPRVVVVT